MSRWTEILEVLAGELDQQLSGLTSRIDEISNRLTSLGERVGADLNVLGVPLLTQDERVKAVMREALETDSGVVNALNSVIRTEIEKAIIDGVLAAGGEYAELDHEHDESEETNGRLDRLEERCDAAGRKLTDR